MSRLGATKLRRGATAAAIALAVGAGLLQISDPSRLSALTLLAVLAVEGWRRGGWRPTWTDATVGAVWIYGLGQCLTAVNTLPAIAMAAVQTSAVMAYALCRCGSHRAVATAVTAVGALVAALVIGSFAVFRRTVMGAGFTSVYDFRFLFQPMGMHCNIVASAMILASGIALMALPRRRQWLRVAAAGLMWVAAASTLSRGALIAMALMWCGLMVTLKPLRLKIAAGVVLAVAIGVVAVWCPAEMAVALRMTATQSQRLSAQSRIDAADASADAFAMRPLMGYGPGNYALAVDRFRPDDTSAAFSTIPPNIVSEIAVEQGAAGLALYGMMTVAVIAAAWRRRRCRADALTGVAVLAALAVKEMTQCSLWSSSGTMLMAASVMGLMQPPGAPLVGRQRRWRTAFAVTWVVAAGVVALTIATGRGWVRPERRGVALLRSGIAAMDDYRRTGSRASLSRACIDLNEAATTLPEERIAENMLAEALWLHDDDSRPLIDAAERAPRNHTLQLLAARATMAEGDTTEGINHLAAAIKVMPRLMLTGWTDSLIRSSGVGPRLRDVIVADAPSSGASAADMARHGFVLYHLGRHSEAAGYLRRAVGEMPSLATPWRLLGEIVAENGDSAEAADCRKRYDVVTFGAFTANSAGLAPREAGLADESGLVWMRERARMGSRYGL